MVALKSSRHMEQARSLERNFFPLRSSRQRTSKGKVADAFVVRFGSYVINKHEFEEGNPESIEIIKNKMNQR